ncbi:dirigent protein 22 [Lactuca sativa]|uniref:dirigent protein 22 n=1 Tax=Lactuca sativa TaxID=4236 RepID=UPI000CAA81EA|nr:dirigent protein 22 [Lactuca sativa]
MAHLLLPLALSLLTTVSLSLPTTNNYWRSIRPNPFKFRTEKFTHFQFYWHDVQSGSNPTSITIVRQSPVNTSRPNGFGLVNMIDDPLTERPDINSKLIGRAQGMYGLASQEEIGLLMAMNFVFMTGRYNGSTLTVLGRNPVFQKVREMPVIGGSGLFRFARGYVHASTHNLNTTTGDAIVKYGVYVLHY